MRHRSSGRPAWSRADRLAHGIPHEASSPPFSPNGRRRGGGADGPAGDGAGVSRASGAGRRRLCRRRADRHRRPRDRPVAVGTARAAIRDREPSGSDRQHRLRGRRQCRAGRLHASRRRRLERHQHDALPEAQLRVSPRHRAGRGHHPRAQRPRGDALVSGTNGPRIHRLCQGKSRQDQFSPPGATAPRSTCPANCSR
jgi:hypothetical protein